MTQEECKSEGGHAVYIETEAENTWLREFSREKRNGKFCFLFFKDYLPKHAFASIGKSDIDLLYMCCRSSVTLSQFRTYLRSLDAQIIGLMQLISKQKRNTCKP